MNKLGAFAIFIVSLCAILFLSSVLFVYASSLLDSVIGVPNKIPEVVFKRTEIECPPRKNQGVDSPFHIDEDVCWRESPYVEGSY